MRKHLLLAFFALVAALNSGAQISGTVYRDYNGNGTRGTVIPSVEPGVEGILVKAYDINNNLVSSVSSDQNGDYTLSTSGAVRVEFEIPAGLNCVSSGMDFTGFHEDGNNIRFITGAASNVNYGILFPDDYTPNVDPFVYVPVFHAGDPLVAGTSSTQNAFAGYTYNSVTAPTSLKTIAASNIGSVWGTAYSKQANKIFTAAFIKRHVGLGPLGTGGIYMLEPTASSFNVTQFYDMDANGYRTRATSGALAYGQSSSYTVDASGFAITYNGPTDTESGFSEGLGVVGLNSTRGLPANINQDSYDPAAFDQVGKVGLGDLDISDDGKFLFVMNLYSRKVYRLELNDAYNPTSVVSVTSYAVPSVAVTNGELRPFAVQYHRGKVYCGAVASGENGGANIVDGATDLYAHVFEMTDPLGSATFNSTPILSYPLNYQKGYAITTMNTAANNKWFPWTNNSNSYLSDPYGEGMYPTPLLSNIDFTDRGDMIMDFTDRSGHQWGYQNRRNLSTTLASSIMDIGGDVLIAGRNCSTGSWTLENDGSINSNGTTLTGNSTTNNEGPGTGEFFAQDRATDDYHHETSQGAVAIVPGTANGIFTLMDPVGIFQGGTGRFNTENGIDGNRTVLYGGNDGEFGKANGLGDVEVAGQEPPIEIGNRVWLDANNNGIQDAGENGIANVTIDLFCDTDNDGNADGSAIATIDTDPNGYWYFNATNVTDGDCSLSGAQPGPQPGKFYVVKVGLADWTSGSGVGELNLLSLTLSDVPLVGILDASDNDATLVSNQPQIAFSVQKLGQNNHTYDFGFKSCLADAGANIALDCNTPSGTIGTAAIGSDTYSWSPTTGLDNPNIAQPTASPSSTTTYTLTVNSLCTDEVTVTVDNTAPTADAGVNKDLDCTTTSTTIGTAAVVGNTYSWAPSTNLSSTSIAEPTANPTASTNYTVTVTGSNGCTATDVVSVNVNTAAPTADAGINKNLDCTTTSTTIGTAAVIGNTYSWAPSTNLSSTSIAEPTANPTASTNYTVTVTGSNGCTATDVVSVNVNTAAPTADAGVNKDLDCATTSTTIGTAAVVGNTYSWAPSTNLSSTSIAEPTANPTTSTDYTVTVTGSNGCTATDVVSVNVNTSAPTADAGVNKDLDCTTTSTTIGTAAVIGNTYSWAPATNLSSTGIAEPTANPTVSTNYTVTVTGSNGCTATDVVSVNVNIAAPTADAGINKNLDCITTSTTIGSSAIVGNTYSWSPATNLSSTNIAEPTADPTSSTNYTVTVTGSNGCSATDVVSVNVDITPPTVSIVGATTVCNGSTTTLNANGGVSWNWLPNNENTQSITAGAGSYTVTATGANGCTNTDMTTLVTVEGSIGNYVWFDANGNGINDELSSSGINGVQVELWKETSAGSNVYSFLQSTTTANNLSNPGYYNFVICESANYKVKFPLDQSGQGLTKQTTTAATDNNNDANASDGFSPVFAIDLNGAGTDKDNATIDAGYYKPAQLGNYVWNDINKDGIQDNTEVGVAGITVTLFDNSNTVIAATITDAYGYYKFAPLEPGTYHVGFTLPANYVFTLSNATTDEVDNDVNPTTGITGDYVIVAGDSNMSVDAGIYFQPRTTASVGNYVWLDVNQDGIQNSNEQGISGVTVTLYNSLGEPIATMLTDADGFYLFTDVVPGNYTVGFTPPAGLTFSPNNGGVTNPSNSDANPLSGITSSFSVNAGDKITYVDAGLYSLSTNVGGLGDKVWYDQNHDGIQDLGETGVAGVTVTLYQADGATVITTTITDNYGNYIFNNLAQGAYVVGFSNLPVGYVLSPTTGTDSTNNSDADVSTQKTPVINLGQGQFNLTYDAGIYSNSMTNTNSLGDYVWKDLDKNGIQDGNEPGVSGITVKLYDNTNTVVATTSTNAAGYYLFPDLPNGTYYVGFSNLPASYVFTQINQGTSATDSDPEPSSGLTGTYSLIGDTHIMTVDAGIKLSSNDIRIGKGTLGDLVWYDLNGNGLQDATESGVAGVTVNLYETIGNTLLATTTTNALGNYIFTNLDAGSYQVEFTDLPVGFVISPKDQDAQGINGELNSDVNAGTGFTDGIVLATGEDKMSVDMGIVPPVGTASLGNLVWFDLNNDGLQTVGEPGVQGVSVSLYDNANTMLATTTTNADGEYYFIGLTPGTYGVGFSNLPEGFTLTTENIDAQGIDGSVNSDANSGTGLTSTVTLLAGDNNLNLDAGIITNVIAAVGDYVWFDANQNGLQDPTESGVGGVLVTLYDNGNLPVSSAITRPDGGYIFTNLNPGTYSIGFSNLPEGTLFTQEVGTSTDNNNSNANPSTGLTASFTLAAGDYNPTIDAGIMPPLTAGLGNFVWYDVNENGNQDASEPGVPGVLATLYAANGTTLIATAVTDGDGGYSFTNLDAGTYVVGFSNLPSGFTPTSSIGVLDDALNSDMNPLTRKTVPVTLVAGTYNPNLDAGIYFGVPLPSKELVASYGLVRDNKTCDVVWYTVDEKNASSFDIERSLDGVNFIKTGIKSAKGNTISKTVYTFNDDISAVSESVIYYRIRMNDVDGQTMYSNRINVSLDANEEVLIVYPTPFTSALNMLYTSKEATDIELILTDISGRIIRKQTYSLNTGLNALQIDDLAPLSNGNYFIKVVDINSGEQFIRKVLK